ncbi:hypothetical protein HYFRA_00003655 [Hymenoscyphus fraxineus]|uniref:Uncharacterized protein n=1 Tax=Hymenoscyphus fraxineus TaxID=746836 RepID=A0A9N9KXP2_9HELO|nr:hypothetical protein HYFRA_00003655 [Hymenoscyphus fraxineus]
MILSSLLHRKQTMGREDEICAAFRKTREVWIRRSGESIEAKKAAKTVGFVLEKARKGHAYSGVDEAFGDSSAHSIGPEFSETPSSRNLENSLGFHESVADGPIMPNLTGEFAIASGDQTQGFGFDIGMNGMEGDMDLNEWMSMNGSGTSW